MYITLDNIREKFENHKPNPIGKHRFFSVLVPFVMKDGKLNLLFEVRARHMESQPGEVCFPGGNMEKGESPIDCALRETYEEIGIDSEHVEVIGKGDTLNGYANYTLYTTIGVIEYKELKNLKLAPEEVDEVFLVEVDKFVDTNPLVFSENIYTEIDEDFPYEMLGIDQDYEWRVGNWEIPIYDIDGRIIWGLTARITRDLIRYVTEKNTFQE